MVIIVGLGNPGKKYVNTRHNIGFQIIDQFAKENKFPEFRLSKKFNALISEKENIILAKPQTFINNSGISVKKLAKLHRTGLCIIHDDIDLALGKIRISKNRGAAGHKGVQSIIKELSSKDFTRVRIGIQPEKGKPESIEKFILQKFKKEQREILKPAIKKSLAELAKLIQKQT